MCIIVYNESGKPHNEEYLSDAYDNNPHGVGIMWVEDGRVQTLRGLFTKRRMFDILREFNGVPHALHLRWRTRGKITKEMCHPFRASAKDQDSKVWLMHNGTFMKIKSDANHSDTFYFARSIRSATAQHGTDVLFSEPFLRKLEDTVESWNKVIFLRDDGKVAIVNPKEWHVEDDIWYSNTYSLTKGYRERKTAKSVTTGWSSYSSSKWTGSKSNSSSKKPDKASTAVATVNSKGKVTVKQTTETNEKGETVHTINDQTYRLSSAGYWVKAESVSQEQIAEESKPRRLFGGALYAKDTDGVWKICQDQEAARMVHERTETALAKTDTPGEKAAKDWQAAMKSLNTSTGSSSGGTSGKLGKGRKKSRRQRRRERNELRKAKADLAKGTKHDRPSAAASNCPVDPRPDSRVVKRRRMPDGTVEITGVFPER